MKKFNTICWILTIIIIIGFIIFYSNGNTEEKNNFIGKVKEYNKCDIFKLALKASLEKDVDANCDDSVNLNGGLLLYTIEGEEKKEYLAGMSWRPNQVSGLIVLTEIFDRVGDLGRAGKTKIMNFEYINDSFKIWFDLEDQRMFDALKNKETPSINLKNKSRIM